MARPRRGLTRLAAGLLLAATAAAFEQTGAPDTSGPARELLEQAGALRRAMRGTRGRERTRLQERALAAYRDVCERFPGQAVLAAEAAFRAGELLRAAGRPDDARVEFERAARLGADTPFRARAGLELGHLCRRAGLFEEALIHYRGVLDRLDSGAGLRDDARLWGARCCAELGRHREARAMFELVARGADDPCDRVAAHDELVLMRIRSGDLEAAAGELQRCRASLAEFAREETPLGARVRSALLRMRSVDPLRRAIARRRDGLVIER